jgi:hypothetical protein
MKLFSGFAQFASFSPVQPNIHPPQFPPSPSFLPEFGPIYKDLKAVTMFGSIMM